MWSCFACERSLVNGSATFRSVSIFANFYVNNALHGATLANCSHFQYVSRLRLRVIWIGVKACIDVTLYDKFFYHLHNRETYPYSTKDNFDRCQWSTPRSLLFSLAKLRAGYTISLVHNTTWFIEPFLCLIHFELFQNFVKVCALWKSY